MKVFLKEEQAAGPRVVCLGMFDGMHRGHQALIRIARRAARQYGAKVRVSTFDRHPIEILKPEAAPKLLTSIPEKAEQLHGLRVDEMEVLPFTRETAEMEPEAFLERLRGRIDVKAIAIGWNYSFGRDGRGNADTLREDAKKHGYQAIVLPAVKNGDGEIISASRIRELLEEGQTDGVQDMLCRDYTMKGTMLAGKEGETGLPAAGLRVWERKMIPGAGVYCCWLEDAEMNEWPGILTLGEAAPEVQVIGATAEEYGTNVPFGKRVRVIVMQKIRDEKPFGSGEERREQALCDIETAKRFFFMA